MMTEIPDLSGPHLRVSQLFHMPVTTPPPPPRLSYQNERTREQMMTKDSKVRTLAGLAVVALVVGVIGIGVTFAHRAGQGQGAAAMGGRGMMAGGPLGAMHRTLAQLGLTDDQKQQIKGIAQGHKADLQAFAERMRQSRVALADAIVNGGDEAAIRAKSADLAKVQADLAVLGAQVRKEVFAVLTPDQQAKAKTLWLQALDRAGRHLQRGKRALEF